MELLYHTPVTSLPIFVSWGAWGTLVTVLTASSWEEQLMIDMLMDRQTVKTSKTSCPCHMAICRFLSNWRMRALHEVLARLLKNLFPYVLSNVFFCCCCFYTMTGYEAESLLVVSVQGEPVNRAVLQLKIPTIYWHVCGEDITWITESDKKLSCKLIDKPLWHLVHITTEFRISQDAVFT